MDKIGKFLKGIDKKSAAIGAIVAIVLLKMMKK